MREDVFFFEGNTHLPMEQHAAVAQWGADGKLTLWSSTQTPHYVHRLLAQDPRRAAGAHPRDRRAGRRRLRRQARPVRARDRRVQALPAHRPAGEVRADARGGLLRPPRPPPGADVDQDRLHEGRRRSPACTSAPGSTAAPTAPTAWRRRSTPARSRPSRTRSPSYKFEGARVFTNKPPCGPKRGHGTPQPRFALECQIDKAAEQLGLDPADMRRRNLAEPFTKTANHLTVTTIGLGECIDRVVEASGWRGASAGAAAARGKGIGIACSSYMTGAGTAIYWNDMPHSGVVVRADRSGGVAVLCGATDIGQGSDSILAYLVAEVLGIEPKDIRVHPADTDLTPVDLGSYSSRVTLMAGNGRDPGRGAAARAHLRRGGDEARGGSRTALAARDRTRRSCRTTEEHGVSVRARRSRSARRCTACSRSRARTRRPSAPASTRAAASARRPATRTRPASSRWTWTRTPARSTLDRGLDRARHRPRAEPAARRGPGRGLDLHGPRRGADGGAGVPQGRAQDPVAARVQEPDHARDAGDPHDPRRDRRSRRARSAPRKRGRGRSCRSSPRSPTRSTTRSACGSTRRRSRPTRCCARSI